ncbi:TrmH family RNA methyltransferase [Buchananella felis]|uniref:TrmH family RNA methyltransferase n=1 Tax=Buchananella felis TaxID=3231492 RepID=UPI003526F775
MPDLPAAPQPDSAGAGVADVAAPPSVDSVGVSADWSARSDEVYAEPLLAPEVGVGPWPGGPECWPQGEHYDPELLANGDRRNVLDHYRYWSREAIVADLDTRRHGFHVAIENLEHDANIGSIVRTANAFLAGRVHVVGRRRWNRRGAMVTDRYQHVDHHPDALEFARWAASQGLPLIAMDICEGSEPLELAQLPERCVLVFGQESRGISAQLLAQCERVLHISQFGSTRSINVGAAAAVAMHAWIRQHARIG